jgi:hypothetical protein
MVANTLEGLHYTSFIKIKCADDVQRLFSLLRRLEGETKGEISKYIIDANASWNVSQCQIFLQIVNETNNSDIRDKILYLEQPFPVLLAEQDREEWQKVSKESCLKIVAD